MNTQLAQFDPWPWKSWIIYWGQQNAQRRKTFRLTLAIRKAFVLSPVCNLTFRKALKRSEKNLTVLLQKSALCFLSV